MNRAIDIAHFLPAAGHIRNQLFCLPVFCLDCLNCCFPEQFTDVHLTAVLQIIEPDVIFESRIVVREQVKRYISLVGP